MRIYDEDCDLTLKEKQAWSLPVKIEQTRQRIYEWILYCKGVGIEPIVMFSGGFDSSILLHIARDIDPAIKGMFSNTGLEFPEIYSHVRNTKNIIHVRFTKHFSKIIKEYGYPVISKKISMGVSRYRNTKDPLQKELRLHGGINPTSGKPQYRTISKKWHHLIDAPFKISEQCCTYAKKNPLKKACKGRAPIIGTLASESDLRRMEYIKHGCNLTGKNPQSKPLSFWLEDDIREYARQFNVPISEIYSMGYDRTGCFPCMFGIHKEGPLNRFQLMNKTHPKLWNYCMTTLGIREVMDYLELPVN